MNTRSDTLKASESRTLLRCALLALFTEFVFLTLAGSGKHWMVHPRFNLGLDESQFIEAEVLTLPETAHLVSMAPPKVTKKETVISKRAGVGRKPKIGEKMEEHNRTDEVQPMPPTHGPVPVYAPSPVIPSYLQNQELKTSVVIEFLISDRGVVTPRLLSGSGNEELDAIALDTARKWVFRPAEQEHVATNSRVRLRIVFEVQ